MKKSIASALKWFSKRSAPSVTVRQPIRERGLHHNKWLNSADEVFAYLEQSDK